MFYDFNPRTINRDGQLKHLIAPDLFAENLKQVFSAKNGKYLGTIQTGERPDFDETEEIEMMLQPKKDPNQLSIF